MSLGRESHLLTETPSLFVFKTLSRIGSTKQYYGVFSFIHVSVHPRLVPQIAYERMKRFLFRHHSLHFFMHQTYCRIICAYISKSYSDFLER
jgi:hypothetical protein